VKFSADLDAGCNDGGGSVYVSASGTVQIQCPVLSTYSLNTNGDCATIGGGDLCLISTHYTMPDTNLAPNKPASPVPADGATQVVGDSLSWSGGDPNAGDPVKYDVWATGNYGLLTLVCEKITDTSCDISDYMGDRKFFTWQVIAYDGKRRVEGSPWTFTTAPRNDPPNAPTLPIPSDNSGNESVSTELRWAGSDPNPIDTLTYNVYVAKLSGSYELACTNVTTKICNPIGDFDYGTTYQWYVEANDGQLTTRGPNWRFATPVGFTVAVDASAATYRDPNEVIEYTYTIHNERNIAINGPIGIQDSRFGTIAACGTTPLAAGATTTCTTTYTTQEADLGTYVRNSAYATLGGVTSPADRASVRWDDPSKLGLVLEADPLVYYNAGERITYTYTIINIGETSLTGPFSVNHHHKEIGLIDPCGDVGTLAVGEQTSCHAVYTLTKQDLDGSLISSEASANAAGSGVGTGGFSPIRVEEVAPALTFHIGYAPLSFSQVGDVINYTYRFSNTGNAPLAGPFKVQIDNIGAAFDPCGSGPLEIGEWSSCTNSYVVTQQDLNRGKLQAHNGRVHTSGVSSERFEVTVPGASTELLLTTVVTPTIYTREGEEIVYQYTISNTGSLTMSAPIMVVNDLNGPIRCNAIALDLESDLGPGMAAICHDVRVIEQEDLSRGVVTSDAVAQTQAATSGNIRSTVNVGSRALALTLGANTVAYGGVGEVVTYTYTIQNMSDVALNGPFTIVDDQTGTISACGDGPLAPSAMTSCTALRTITEDDINAGSITSTAFVHSDGTTSPSVQLTLTAQNSPNQAPTAVDDVATATPGSTVTITVTSNDSDADGDALSVTILTPPANGTATLVDSGSNGQIVYRPNAGFSGTDSFTYRVSDGKGGNATATVTVTVDGGESGNADQRIYLPVVSR